MNLDLHKELYFVEWSRKEQLASSTSLPVGILTVLAGGTFYLIQTFPYSWNAWAMAFVALAAGSVFFQLASGYFLYRSLHGYWYEQVPSSGKLKAHFEELKSYHSASDNPIDRAREDFSEYLESRLAQAADANRENNNQTAGALHRATRMFGVALLLAALSLLPYLKETMTREPDTPSVRVVESVNVHLGAPMTENTQQQKPEKKPDQEAFVPPEKPQGPPNELVRKDGTTREKKD